MANEVPIEEQPELKKKPKLEVTDEDEFCADNENGLHKMNPKEWRQYIDHVNESGGFDVPEFANSIFLRNSTFLRSLFRRLDYCEVKESSIFTAQKHNKKEGTNYMFYRLAKVNMEPVSGVIYYITFLAEDLKRKVDSGSGSGDLEKVHVGQNGCLLVELQAKVYYPIPDEERKTNMELLYFNVNDTISEEGIKVLMEVAKK